MVDREQPTDATKAVAFEVEFERRLLCFLVIAERSRRGRVLATTLLALETLITSARKTGFDLARSVLAMGTSNHVERYTIICFDLDSPLALTPDSRRRTSAAATPSVAGSPSTRPHCRADAAASIGTLS